MTTDHCFQVFLFVVFCLNSKSTNEFPLGHNFETFLSPKMVANAMKYRDPKYLDTAEEVQDFFCLTISYEYHAFFKWFRRVLLSVFQHHKRFINETLLESTPLNFMMLEKSTPFPIPEHYQTFFIVMNERERQRNVSSMAYTTTADPTSLGWMMGEIGAPNPDYN